MRVDGGYCVLGDLVLLLETLIGGFSVPFSQQLLPFVEVVGLADDLPESSPGGLNSAQSHPGLH